MVSVNVTLLVIAKQPLPGRVKTRLCPPCQPAEAARLAAAALGDTLAAVAATAAARRVLVFDGDPSDWLAPGFDVIAQRGDGLGERLQAAFDAVTGPALLIGMDTPQISAARLAAAAARLARCDAVIAPTDDGGYWCVGFREPVPGAFRDVPMSTGHTYASQLARFEQLGLSVAIEPRLRDVDTISDARIVARQVPSSRFAHALAAIEGADLRRAA